MTVTSAREDVIHTYRIHTARDISHDDDFFLEAKKQLPLSQHTHREMATFCAPWTDCWKDTSQEERGAPQAHVRHSKEASIEHGAPDQIKDSVEEVQEVEGCRQERRQTGGQASSCGCRPPQATHTALVEIMRLSQEEEDFEVVLFGEGDNYEVDFAEGGKMSPFTLTMEKILVYCHEHGIPITFFIFKRCLLRLTESMRWRSFLQVVQFGFVQDRAWRRSSFFTTSGSSCLSASRRAAPLSLSLLAAATRKFQTSPSICRRRGCCCCGCGCGCGGGAVGACPRGIKEKSWSADFQLVPAVSRTVHQKKVLELRSRVPSIPSRSPAFRFHAVRF